MIRFVNTIVLLLLLKAAFAQSSNYCLRNRFSQNYFFDSNKIRIDSNIQYARSKNFLGVMQNLEMDVFYPKFSDDNLTKRPIILFIHGGSFQIGSRRDMWRYCMEYARRGYVAATATYRLGWGCQADNFVSSCLLCQLQIPLLGIDMPADARTAVYRAAQDGRAAMRYLHTNAASFRADTGMMFIGGESAGAITAMHTSYWDQNEASQFCPWGIAQAGQLDTAGNNLPNLYRIKAVVNSCGAIDRDTNINGAARIPIVSFHDEGDFIVPYTSQSVICNNSSFFYVNGSALIHARQQSRNTCSELNYIPGSILHCGYPFPNIINRSLCFLKRVMCGNCQTLVNSNQNATTTCDTLGSFPTSTGNINPDIGDFNVSPNPAHDQVLFSFYLNRRSAVQIILTDALGRSQIIAFKGMLPPGRQNQEISIQKLARGLYFYQIIAERTKLSGKLVVD